MYARISFLRWVAGGLLAMFFAAGCTTMGGGTHTTPDGKYEFNSDNLDDAADQTHFNPDNYHYHWILVTADNTCYERTEFYITRSLGTPKPPCEWHYPPAHKRSVRGSGAGGSYEEYGWYTCITHPPGGGTIEQEVVISITHPPGGAPIETSK